MHVQALAGDRAFVIRGLLSPEECAAWIARAEGLGFGDAPVHTLLGERMKPSVRNNTRVILDSTDEADALFARCRHLLCDSEPHPIGFNERLRFYRYEPGQYFRPHLDGAWHPPDGKSFSLYSVLIYLNQPGQPASRTTGTSDATSTASAPTPPQRVADPAAREDFEGGATRLLQHGVDVQPETGMALFFTHRQLHSGAEVTSGRKYVLRTDLMFPKEGWW